MAALAAHQMNAAAQEQADRGMEQLMKLQDVEVEDKIKTADI